jgi:hypothetical protein
VISVSYASNHDFNLFFQWGEKLYKKGGQTKKSFSGRLHKLSGCLKNLSVSLSPGDGERRHEWLL